MLLPLYAPSSDDALERLVERRTRGAGWVGGVGAAGIREDQSGQVLLPLYASSSDDALECLVTVVRLIARREGQTDWVPLLIHLVARGVLLGRNAWVGT